MVEHIDQLTGGHFDWLNEDSVIHPTIDAELQITEDSLNVEGVFTFLQ